MDSTQAPFDIFWLSGAWSKHGRAEAQKRFTAQIKTDAAWRDIQAARDAYNAYMLKNSWRTPMMGSTWFGKLKGWRDWIPDERVEALTDDPMPEEHAKHICELCIMLHEWECMDQLCTMLEKAPCPAWMLAFQEKRKAKV